MSDQRYFAHLIVTEQDFAECNWKALWLMKSA